MGAVKELMQMALEAKMQKHSTFPAAYLPKTKYTDKTANGLTKCIVDFLHFKGHYATRINTTGVYRENIGMYTKGGTAKGTADIHACLNVNGKGIHVSIEVKINDKQSMEQKEVQAQVEAAGGYYYVARSFQDFYNWYNSLMAGNYER